MCRSACQVVSTAGAVLHPGPVGFYVLGLCTCDADAAGGFWLLLFSCDSRGLCTSFLQVRHTITPLQSVRQPSSSSRMTALRHRVLHLKQQQQQSLLPYSQRMPSTIGESNGEAKSLELLNQPWSRQTPSAFLRAYAWLSGKRLDWSLHSRPHIFSTQYSSCGTAQVPCSLRKGCT